MQLDRVTKCLSFVELSSKKFRTDCVDRIAKNLKGTTLRNIVALAFILSRWDHI